MSTVGFLPLPYAIKPFAGYQLSITFPLPFLGITCATILQKQGEYLAIENKINR